MSHIGFIVALLLVLSPGTTGRNLMLGVVNGEAAVKTSGSTRWRAVSSNDMGMTMQLKDSVHVKGKSLFIREEVGGRMKGYQADAGKWTVEEIVKGKAYHTERKRETAGEAVKGDYRDCYFDLLVGAVATEMLHFGDHPELRVINDSGDTVFFSVFWSEGGAWWSMLDTRESVCLEAKSSTLEQLRDSFVIGPPEGDAEVFLILSDAPFIAQEALRSLAIGEGTIKTLVKRVVICE